jgi:hypothetical protein
MKLLTKIALGLLIMATTFILTYRAINLAPTKGLPFDDKFKAIMENSGCFMCHNKSATLPKYSEWPLIGNKIKRDALTARNRIDIYEIWRDYQNGIKVEEQTPLLVKNAVISNSMPPFSYTILRPGSAINNGEEKIIIEWLNKL